MNYLRMLSLLSLCMLLNLTTIAQTRSNPTAAGSNDSAHSSTPAPGYLGFSVTGSGTTNYIPLWTGSTALGNSVLFQSGTKIGIDNAAPGYALDVTGWVNNNKGYKISGTTLLAIPGGTIAANTALGDHALPVTTGGSNTAGGSYALSANTTGYENTAFGQIALENNTTGFGNTGIGAHALSLNGTGNGNTAVGNMALVDNVGNYNTAVGYESLGGGIGTNNIALGYSAGISVANNSNNIEIGNVGINTDSGTIRIGTLGTQTTFFAAGIYGVSAGNNEAIPVLIDSSGQLVTASSSRRFKQDIQDMNDASSGLMRLRPVTFRYKKPLADGSQPLQYGLIAEEVAEVYPDLVSHSADGQIQTVKYQLLDPMLLNELQRQHAEITRLQERLDRMEAALTPSSGAQAGR